MFDLAMMMLSATPSIRRAEPSPRLRLGPAGHAPSSQPMFGYSV
jgi:hypothetical protein